MTSRERIRQVEDEVRSLWSAVRRLETNTQGATTSPLGQIKWLQNDALHALNMRRSPQLHLNKILLFSRDTRNSQSERPLGVVSVGDRTS